MVFFRAKVSYHGRAFHGWQKQEGLRTTQNTLEETLSKINNAPVEVLAAGRTDSGVHAHGQVVAWHMRQDIDAYKMQKACAGLLPSDIALRDIHVFDAAFDPKNHALGKHYIYAIRNEVSHDPFTRGQYWRVPYTLDESVLHDTSNALVGEHDFEAFRSSACQASHARRYLWGIRVESVSSGYRIHVKGNAFCHNMVRIIVGTLVDIGRGKIEMPILDILQSRNREHAGITAPAHGLTLNQVFYPDAMIDADIPHDAKFPRFPVTHETWPFEQSLSA